MYFVMDKDAEYNKYSGWTGRVEIEDKRLWLNIFLPDNWYNKVEFFGEVCAYAGYQNASSTYDLGNALDVAYKPWKWGDMAMRFIVEELRHKDVEDLADTIRHYGGTTTVTEYEKEE